MQPYASVATCPSGQGAVCKTAYTGSIPVVASTIQARIRPTAAGPGLLEGEEYRPMEVFHGIEDEVSRF